jgi:hypothetical protein
LKAASVLTEAARDSTEELGIIEEQYGGLRSDFSQIHVDLAYIRRRSDVLIWVVWINAAATLAILGILLRR